MHGMRRASDRAVAEPKLGSEPMPDTGETPGEHPHLAKHPKAAEEAEARWWPDVPCVSAGELAWALRRIGLDARLEGPDHVVLMRGRSALAIVPLHERLHPATTRSILRALGISPHELRRLLEQG